MKKTLMKLIFAVNLSQNLIAGEVVKLDIANSNITKFNNTSYLDFTGVGSDGVDYAGSLNCMDYKNSRVPNEGIIYVLNGPSHMGVKAILPYDRCLDLVDSFIHDNGVLSLMWQSEEYDDFLTGNISWALDVSK